MTKPEISCEFGEYRVVVIPNRKNIYTNSNREFVLEKQGIRDAMGEIKWERVIQSSIARELEGEQTENVYLQPILNELVSKVEQLKRLPKLGYKTLEIPENYQQDSVEDRSPGVKYRKYKEVLKDVNDDDDLDFG